MDGLGRFEWAHGDVYHGQWKQGRIEGEGCLMATNGTVSDGVFQEGLLHGYAKKVLTATKNMKCLSYLVDHVHQIVSVDVGKW